MKNRIALSALALVFFVCSPHDVRAMNPTELANLKPCLDVMLAAKGRDKKAAPDSFFSVILAGRAKGDPAKKANSSFRDLIPFLANDAHARNFTKSLMLHPSHRDIVRNLDDDSQALASTELLIAGEKNSRFTMNFTANLLGSGVVLKDLYLPEEAGHEPKLSPKGERLVASLAKTSWAARPKTTELRTSKKKRSWPSAMRAAIPPEPPASKICSGG